MANVYINITPHCNWKMHTINKLFSLNYLLIFSQFIMIYQETCDTSHPTVELTRPIWLCTYPLDPDTIAKNQYHVMYWPLQSLTSYYWEVPPSYKYFFSTWSLRPIHLPGWIPYCSKKIILVWNLKHPLEHSFKRHLFHPWVLLERCIKIVIQYFR